MRNLYGLTIILLFIQFSVVAQTTIQIYPNSNACQFDLALDADTIWTGSTGGLQKCYNDTCISYNTSNSGITHNRCLTVSIDSSGNIWAGTYNGICVFNHQTWQTFNTQNSGLPNDTITYLYHTNSGVWIGNNGGLTYFDGTNWTTYNTQNSGILSNAISDIAILNNDLYTAHNGIGLSKFENNSWTTWPINAFHVEEAGGRIWISGSYSGLSYLDQNAIISFDSLLNDFNFRTPYFKVHRIQNGIVADQESNLVLIENSSYTYYIIKITPSLKILSNRIVTWPFLSTGTRTRARIKNNKLWCTAFLPSGLKNVTIDTSAYNTALSDANNYLDINNSTVRVLNRGDMHWDPVDQVPKYFSDTWSFRKPVFASAIWLGGIDQGNQLHTAAMSYRQSGAYDFWTGPLDTLTGAADTISERYYDRFWKIDYNMIQGFIINYQNGNVQNGTYDIPEAIATWPAHGTGNHTRNLAPFVDANNDGVYNPMDGDYPELTGHQTLWWVFNDNLYIHTESDGAPFGFEIQGKAYGFNCNLNTASDEVMNNTTFYQYKITNRSQNTYHDVYIGLWTDFDLGNASDDYVACDTMLNTYYCYNGDNDDDGGGGYGLNPPMMNVTILKGPIVQSADGEDNNHDGIIDEPNETTGMSSFLFYVTSGINSEPHSDSSYYGYLRSIWQTGNHVTYGGSGNNPANPPTDYMFSGVPYSGSGWTMVSAGMQPDDMRGTGSSGPFTISPGETRTIDFAYIFTRDSINPNGVSTSIAKNTADVQKIINGFNSGNYPCLTSVGLPTLNQPALNFNVYPNPTTNTLNFNKEMIGAEYKIYSVTGQLIKSGIYYGSAIPTENLTPQLYIIKASKAGMDYMKRFVKM